MSEKVVLENYLKILESEYGGSPNNVHISRHRDELHVELTYPPHTNADNVNGQCRYVYVNQESVRASDGIRMCYDFERDGWSIQQGSVWEWDSEEESTAPNAEDWQEVAFVQSWARDPDRAR